MLLCKVQSYTSSTSRARSGLFWISFVLLFRQYSVQHKQFASNRVINIWTPIWSASMLILTSTFAGCIYSLLAVPDPTDTIDTIGDLYISSLKGKVIINAIRENYYTHSLQNSPTKLFKKISEKLNLVDNEGEGYKRILEASFDNEKNGEKPLEAFIKLRSTLFYWCLRYGSNHVYLPKHTIHSTFFIDPISIPTKVNFLFAFFIRIKKIIDSGIILFWRKKEYVRISWNSYFSLKNQNLQLDEDDENIVFTLMHFSSFFIMFITSISISFLVLIIEILCQLYFKNSKLCY